MANLDNSGSCFKQLLSWGWAEVSSLFLLFYLSLFCVYHVLSNEREQSSWPIALRYLSGDTQWFWLKPRLRSRTSGFSNKGKSFASSFRRSNYSVTSRWTNLLSRSIRWTLLTWAATNVRLFKSIVTNALPYFLYILQRCFVYRLSNSTVPEDAGTVAEFTLTERTAYHWAIHLASTQAQNYFIVCQPV
jgi:hypothetical protein